MREREGGRDWVGRTRYAAQSERVNEGGEGEVKGEGERKRERGRERG